LPLGYGVRDIAKCLDQRPVFGREAGPVGLDADQDYVGIAAGRRIVCGRQGAPGARFGDEPLEIRLVSAQRGPSGIDRLDLPA
jgi:hypothetical protein